MLAHQHYGCGLTYRGERGSFHVRLEEYRRLQANVETINFVARVFDDPRVAAMYFHTSDTVQYRQDQLQEAHAPGSLVHELVHYLQDEQGFDGYRWEWEASAYLAQTLWSASVWAFLSQSGRRMRIEDYLTACLEQQPDEYPGMSARILLEAGAGSRPVAIGAASLRVMIPRLRASSVYAARLDDVEVGNGIRRR